MKYLEYRAAGVAAALCRQVATTATRPWVLMEVCGGQTHSIVRYGIDQTLRDAARIRAAGCPVVQINTGSGCHLDAEMLAEGLRRLDPPMHSVLMIENVGNLVCPALFDLGEHTKAVIMSVTEGEDKPLKYPVMFHKADLVLISKIDLLPYLPDISLARIVDSLRRVMPDPRYLAVSARTGQGIDEWITWLAEHHVHSTHAHPAHV